MPNPPSDEHRVSQTLERVLAQASRIGASDIHFEPREGRLRIRFRVDGVMSTHAHLPGELMAPVTIRLKVLAGLDISERRLPQDGAFQIDRARKTTSYRVSTFPTADGEKIVLRLLSRDGEQFALDDLGMPPTMVETLRHVIGKPNGLVLVTGPTGSGKTSTLYALLRELASDELNIVTLEDPVEARIPGITQGQTLVKAGFTFATGLRAILRQDPDVIMVGEMRDTETAQIAFRAGLTGHLVLSTLHTNGAVETFVRMRDMGLEPYVVASALRAVIAQRLVRGLCSACRIPTQVDPKLRAALALDTDAQIYQARGCPQCGQSGYKGRSGIFEIVEMDEDLADLMKAEDTARHDIAQALKERNVVSLRRAGGQCVASGKTTVDEVMRVT